jgi:hypothetical protein
MMHIVCTTDPISGHDVADVSNHPFVHEQGNETDLTIYFESEGNRQAYLAIPVEHPLSEHRVNLDNPTDVFIDEG